MQLVKALKPTACTLCHARIGITQSYIQCPRYERICIDCATKISQQAANHVQQAIMRHLSEASPKN